MIKAPRPRAVDWEVVEVAHVVDGDTVDLLCRRPIGELDGFTLEATGVIRVRVMHVDTPERGQPGFTEATEDARAWLLAHPDWLRVTIMGKDRGGRSLGNIYVNVDVDGFDNLSEHMIREKNWPPYIPRKERNG